ncbi:hypothetical protein [uncultured Ruminococcus sp.]|uniref:YczE/YyaS/YitT family protein n=1 Tax=uncultured Ruminococcus sp. TaxID=165186 RepID=UPI0025D4F374|nr:hypothetical protein [uncultured Ruminococcus sp.]
MQQKTKETLVRLILLFIGLVIAHLGVTLFLLADSGADPFNVMIQGLRLLVIKTGLFVPTHGIVHMSICFLIILILLIIDRSYIKLGTIVCMFCGGPIIDFFTWLLSGLKIGDAVLPVKIAVLIIGCGILAFGMSIVIKSEAGTGPNDLVAVVISDKRKIRFAAVRITTDVIFVVTGFLLGGKFGIGTIICAFLVGPVADICMPFSKSIAERCVHRISKNNS